MANPTMKQPEDVKVFPDVTEDALAKYDKDQATKTSVVQFGVNPIDIKVDQVKLTQDLSSMFARWKDWRRDSRDWRWDEIDKSIHTLTKLKSVPSICDVKLPLPEDAIDQAEAKFIGLTATPDKLFGVESPDEQTKQIAENKQRLIVDQLKQSNTEIKTISHADQLVRYGTTIAHTKWFSRWRKVHSNQPYEQEWSWKIVEERPDHLVVDVRDFYPEPDVEDPINTGTGVFWREWISYDEYKELCFKDEKNGIYPTYVDDPKVTPIQKNSGNDDKDVRRTILREQPSSENKVELLHFWGLWDIEGDGNREETHLVLANRSVLVAAGANPYWHQNRPFGASQFKKISGQFYGGALLEPVISLSRYINSLAAIRHDDALYSMKDTWIVDENAPTNWNDFIRQRNGDGIIRKRPNTNISHLDRSSTSDAILQDIQSYIKLFYNLTVPEILTGTSATAETATTAKLAISQASGKFAVAAKLFQMGIIKPIVETFDQLNLQFLSDDKIINTFYGRLFPGPVTSTIVRSRLLFTFKYLDEILSRNEKMLLNQGFMQIYGTRVGPRTTDAYAKEYTRLIGMDPTIVEVPEATAAPTNPTIPNPAGELLNPDAQGQLNEMIQNGPEAGANVKGANPVPRA